jgi:predicted dehydrogenase
MLKAAQKSGKLHGYAETEVFSPCVVKARETIEQGGIGRVLWVRSRESHSGPHSPHFWDIEKTGGGAMNDLACHCVEAARYFFGKEDQVVEVMAWGANLVHHKKTKGEDNALLVLKFASGGIGHCELSWTTKGGLDLRNEIHGSDGSIFTDVTRGTPITSFTSKSAGYVIEKADIDFGWTRPLPEEAFAYGYQAEMRHFVECVRDGVQPRESYEDGYIVNCILDAGYQSMRNKKWVRVKYA